MTITNDNYESLLFQYAEGSLSEADRHAVEAWLSSHPDAAKELALFSSCPTLELPPVAMPGKEALRRKAMVFAPWWRYAAAACAVLLIGLLVWLRPSTPQNEPVMVAEKHNIPIENPTVARVHTPTPSRGTPPILGKVLAAAPKRGEISSEVESPAVAEVPTVQSLPEEETVVIIYEEILVPCTDKEPVLAKVAVDSAYSPTLVDRLEDWSSQYTSQLYSQYQMARAEVLTRLSRRPF